MSHKFPERPSFGKRLTSSNYLMITDIDNTLVGDVMSVAVDTIPVDMETDEALKLMFTQRRCYYPVVDSQGAIKGWLALCHLFQNHVEDLGRELDSLESYISADGPGG